MPTRKYSLRTMFAWVAIPALTLALIVSVSKLRNAESHLALLEDRFGLLRVTDPNKFQVVAALQTQKNRYQWQVHLPAGRRYYLRAAHGLTRSTELPPKDTDVNMIGGTEIAPAPGTAGRLVTFQVIRSADEWTVRLGTDDSSTEQEHGIASFAWLGSAAGHRTRCAGTNGTETQTANDPLILLHHRRDVLSTLLPGQTAPPAESIVVWIQEFRETSDGELLFKEREMLTSENDNAG